MKMQKLLIILFFGINLFSGCDRHVCVFPEDSWEKSSPLRQGIDPQKIDTAIRYLEANCGKDGIDELVIIRNGYIVYAGEHADSIHNIWSCSKTFTSTVLGLLTDRKIVSPQDTAASIEYLLQKKYGAVTLANFATMTSGYDAVGKSRSGSGSEDWSRTVYDPAEPLFPPGTAFAYWDEAQMMFARVLTRITGETLENFLKTEVTDAIGMQWSWGTEKEVDGIVINNGCTLVKTDALNLARWGWLFLNSGNWNGKQLISRSWVKKATSVQVPSSLPVADTDRKSLEGSGCYGYNWWVNGRKADGKLMMPGAPEGCFLASGYNNNKCIVIPEWKMVVVRMGQDGSPANANEIYGNFLRMIGESLQN
jgi:CubicO group peptidase (beta-lactamase class C family)